jgi:L-2-hydroxyglutarate oxidase
VATEAHELPALDRLWDRGRQNGLRGLRRLGPEELREIEPHVAGVAAIHVPEEGIVDYLAVCAVLQRAIEGASGLVRTSSRVTRIEERTAGWRVGTESGAHECDYLINCAGLFPDRIAELAGIRRTVRIVPFPGEYFMLRPSAQSLVRHLVYPVPDARFPFLGVHFTRMIHGGVEAGPNAVLALSREGYSWRDFSARDMQDALCFPGRWRFLRKYPALCSGEIVRSLSRRPACGALQKLVPALRPQDLQPGARVSARKPCTSMAR